MKTHGLSHTREYRAWVNMRERCWNPSYCNYKNYGGRGIKIDGDWNSFEMFFKDMGLCPAGLTLERKNNNGNYTKDNCKWATRTEQQNNKRNSVTSKKICPPVPRKNPSFEIKSRLAAILNIDTDTPPPLTRSQRNYLLLGWNGLSDKEIAIELGLTVKGVEYHAQKLRDKWGARNLIELCRIALVHGYLTA